jgi:hypothetical protein
VTDGLEDVAGHHAVCSGLVSRFFVIESSHGTDDVTDTVGDENTGRGNNSLGVRTDVGGNHDKTNGESDRLTAKALSADDRNLSSVLTYLTSQNPINRGQVMAWVKGRKAMRAVPKTQIKLPTVIISSRVLAHRVATRPAIMREMTWSDRPAQSRRAAFMVEKPSPLMMDPEKFVKTPLGTEDPNMAIVKSQLTGQR